MFFSINEVEYLRKGIRGVFGQKKQRDHLLQSSSLLSPGNDLISQKGPVSQYFNRLEFEAKIT